MPTDQRPTAKQWQTEMEAIRTEQAADRALLQRIAASLAPQAPQAPALPPVARLGRDAPVAAPVVPVAPVGGTEPRVPGGRFAPLDDPTGACYYDPDDPDILVIRVRLTPDAAIKPGKKVPMLGGVNGILSGVSGPVHRVQAFVYGPKP